MIKKRLPAHPLDERLAVLVDLGQQKNVTIKTILKTLGGKGKAIVLIFLSLPFCQPIQIPGLSTPFGLIIALIGIGIALNHRKIWLPNFLLTKSLKGHTVKKIAKKSLWLANKLRKWIHPRLKVMCTHYVIIVLNGIIIFILGILLALPVPVPFTNLAAAWGIFLLSLGLLEEDGLLVSIGYGIALACIMFFIIIGFSLNLIG